MTRTRIATRVIPTGAITSEIVNSPVIARFVVSSSVPRHQLQPERQGACHDAGGAKSRELRWVSCAPGITDGRNFLACVIGTTRAIRSRMVP